MLPLGRRRAGALSPHSLLLCLFLLFARTASAAVLGIDFGTLNIKAALIAAGKNEIVLTKDSKRKETAAVAFKPNRDSKGNFITQADVFPERAYGGDALALQGRFPSEVFPNLKQLLGLPFGEDADQTVAIYKERYPGVQVEQSNELGTTVFKSSAFPIDASPFSVEELIGMELANVKRNAEALVGKNGGVVEDAVITIPAFYTADERRALIKAANFAGLNVLGLISDGLAVGLDYAKPRTFPEITKGEKPEYHVVFDMGAGSTTATLMRFQSRSVKDVGKFNKTVQEVAVLGVGYERTLGGDALNHVILDDFVHKLLTKPVLKNRGTTADDVKSNGRLMARLYKEAERARQVLSANNEVNVGLEELLPDIDFRTKLTRAEFEKLAAGHAERVGKPIVEALKMAKLDIADVNSVILHGGALRTPFVQSKLEEVVDDKAKLRSNVNADESAVFGAAFKAASLSPSFRAKEIRNSDIAVYPSSLTYLDGGSEKIKALFHSDAPVGAGATTKQVSFKDKEDFAFGFVQIVEGIQRSVLRVKSDNLTASADELKSKFGCAKDDMNTKFSIKLSAHHGLPDVISGSVSCEVDSSKSGSVGDSVKGWLGFGKKKDQEPLADGAEDDGPVEQLEATSSSASASGTASASSDAASQTPKKHLEVIPLKWTSTPEGNPQPDATQLIRMSDRLKAFDDSDHTRFARDEAQNVLESYTYYVRDFLENSEYENFSTKDERSALSTRLTATKEWMESSDLSKATTETLKEKHRELKKLVDPIKTRRSESISRPGLVSALQKSLDDSNKLILKVEEQAAKASKSLAAAASSAASAATAAPSSDTDNLDDEESITSEAAPSATVEKNPFATLDVTKLQEAVESASSWLKEKLEEQKKLKANQDPVLYVRDLRKKAEELTKVMTQLSTKFTEAKKPKPRPKPSPKPKAKKSKAKDAEEPVPAGEPIPGDGPEGASGDAPPEPEPVDEVDSDADPKQKFDKPVKGSESIEDMLDWLNKGKKDDGGHDEL